MICAIARRFANLHLTESCASRIKAICKENEFLRLQVEGGEGCGGFSYKFEVDSGKEDSDFVVEQAGAKLVVDKDSLQVLEGSTVDYTQEMIRNSFVVKENPKAEMTCGCGTSFSPKDFK